MNSGGDSGGRPGEGVRSGEVGADAMRLVKVVLGLLYWQLGQEAADKR